MADLQELQDALVKAQTEQAEAAQAFEALRAKGSAQDLVNAASRVQKAERSLTAAQGEVDNFALVGVYQGIREQVMSIASSWDVMTLAEKDVNVLTITIPVVKDDKGNPTFAPLDKVVVNTLGKRTIVKSPGASTGNGSRSRNVYTFEGAALTSREIVEQHGLDVLGQETYDKVLAEPGRFGLTHAADRVAKAIGADKGVA